MKGVGDRVELLSLNHILDTPIIQLLSQDTVTATINYAFIVITVFCAV